MLRSSPRGLCNMGQRPQWQPCAFCTCPSLTFASTGCHRLVELLNRLAWVAIDKQRQAGAALGQQPEQGLLRAHVPQVSSPADMI